MTATAASPSGERRSGIRPLLSIENLTVEFRTERGPARVVDDVSLDVRHGETLGLVGESGSGKTMIARAILGLVPHPHGRVREGSVRFEDRELLGLSPRELSDIRGRGIAMIFQEPTRSLNPAYTVGDQIAEVVRRHRGASRRAAWNRAVETLDLTGIPSPARRAGDYPHQFSGGMCQRVMLAIALACEPKLLIADEPTTALDVTVQAQVLRLLQEVQDATDISILLITHDLGIVAEMCSRVAVMYAGQIVETADVDDLFRRPRHPYTAGLLSSVLDVLLVDEERSDLGSIRGTIPPPHRLPAGCRFHPRCDHATSGRCDVEAPSLEGTGAGRSVRCLRHAELALRGIGDD